MRFEHNMWAYIFFFIHLNGTKVNDYTALEMFVFKLVSVPLLLVNKHLERSSERTPSLETLETMNGPQPSSSVVLPGLQSSCWWAGGACYPETIHPWTCCPAHSPAPSHIVADDVDVKNEKHSVTQIIQCCVSHIATSHCISQSCFTQY